MVPFATFDRNEVTMESAERRTEMPEDKIPNPYPGHHSTGTLYELMKDEQWHTKAELRSGFDKAGWGNLFSSRLSILTRDGLTHDPPRYPLGRWRVEKRKGHLRLKFNDPIDTQKLDENNLRKTVESMMVDILRDGGLEKLVHKAMDEREADSIEKKLETIVPTVERVVNEKADELRDELKDWVRARLKTGRIQFDGW